MSVAFDRTPQDVFETHLEQAADRCRDWFDALDSTGYFLEDLRDDVEARALAHVDGLEVGGPGVVERWLEPALSGDDVESWRAMAAALVSLCSADLTAAKSLIARLPELPAPARVGVGMALGMRGRRELAPAIADVARNAKGELQATLLTAVGQGGYELRGFIEAALASEDPAVRIAAARACIGADRRVQPWVEWAIQSSDEDLRDAALPAGLVVGAPSAAHVVNELALRSTKVHADAMMWLAVIGDRAAIAALSKRLADEDARAAAMFALGFSGRPAAADACIPWLTDAVLGPLAGEAFAAITGIDAKDRRYWLAPEAVATLDDDAAPDLTQPPAISHGLAVPCAPTISQWWSSNRGRFAPDQRYSLGQPADLHGLIHSLRRESLRRRHMRSLELLVRTAGRAHVHTRVLTAVQFGEMATLGASPH